MVPNACKSITRAHDTATRGSVFTEVSSAAGLLLELFGKAAYLRVHYSRTGFVPPVLRNSTYSV